MKPDLSQATWRKSTRSGNNGGACVEVAIAPTAVGLRDSKDQTGPILAVTCTTWTTFVAGLKDSQFDR